MSMVKRVVTAVVATGAAVVSASGGAAAQPSTGQASSAAVTCIGTSFSVKLSTNQAICNSGYSLVMQDNGDLVLRRSNGSACYASGTRAPGDATATFHGGWDVQPYVDIDSVSQGFRGRIWGANRLPAVGTNANVNNKGEFWIGYRKIGYC
ncbi:hypothetical protein AB0C59_33875 [Streptomyces sp. NPDC048664]|uniref:hypothetical protein n=1 Tax=Streptomyces sp. NPDC048664 TaxID=3154505 RepID=UPI00343E9F22